MLCIPDFSSTRLHIIMKGSLHQACDFSRNISLTSTSKVAVAAKSGGMSLSMPGCTGSSERLIGLVKDTCGVVGLHAVLRMHAVYTQNLLN